MAQKFLVDIHQLHPTPFFVNSSLLRVAKIIISQSFVVEDRV